MAHVIDSLVIELGLDATKFDAQQKKAVEAAKKTTDEVRRRSSEVEDSTDRVGESIAMLGRRAVGMFAVLAGVDSLRGFVTDTIQAGAAVGRLSRAIGQSASDISKWQGLAREFGSTGEQMAGSFQQLSNVFTSWQVGGPEAPGIMPIFRAINTEAQKLDAANARTIDSTKSLQENYLALAQNLKIIHDLAQDQNLASYLAGKIPGMDAGMFDMLIQGSDKLIEKLQKIQGWTDSEAEAAGRLQRRWDALKVSTENFGLKLLFGAIDLAHYLLVTPQDGGKATTYTRPAVNSTPVDAAAGGFRNPSQKEAFIRQQASSRGINPDYAMAVARSEGFSSFVGDNGTSFGAYQLHITPGRRGHAVGDQFREQTGLDPSDPANEARTITFALDWVQKHGWTDFHGAANGAHLSQWAGVDRNAPAVSSQQTTFEINGPINLPGVRDPQDFTNRLRELGLRRQAEANQASVGGE
jgi:hypothetical protein